MKFPLILASILLFCQHAEARFIHVGLFHDQVIKSAVISCATGKYNIESDDGIVGFLDEGDNMFVKLENDSITLYDSQLVYGRFTNLKITYIGLNSSFRFRPIDPASASRTYDDNLILKANDRFITAINHIDFDKYLAGVVEAEGGPNAEKEYYKAQSVLCRTFAIKYLDKHADEGFSLCDGVHCQAYKGKSIYNPGILEAIESTSGLVLLDAKNQLITAAYHSNSGGQTQRAAEVWITDEPYLQSVVDPFSLHQPNAKWYDTISFKDWKDYLYANGMKSVTKIPDEIIYVEQMRRKKFFILDKDSIPMTKIREDWGFRSTFFDMFPEGDSVVIWGKGYGHGIGMSQEGAMKMAQDSYLYKDILQFYFFDVKFMDYNDLPSYTIPELDF